MNRNDTAIENDSYVRWKPALMWVKRVGTGSSRDDAKDGDTFSTIQNVFSKHFRFSFLSPESYKSVSSAEHNRVKEILQHIHDMDVIVGLYGAGLWNSLFMKVYADIYV